MSANTAGSSHPGLYFVGLPFLYALSSEMIHGVERDAVRIAELTGSNPSRARKPDRDARGDASAHAIYAVVAGDHARRST